jgi:hypothetical protein
MSGELATVPGRGLNGDAVRFMIGDAVLVIAATSLLARRPRASRQEAESDVAILRVSTFGVHRGPADATLEVDEDRKHAVGIDLEDTAEEGSMSGATGAEATTEAKQFDTLVVVDGAPGYAGAAEGTAFTKGAKLDGCLVSLLKGVATLKGVSILFAGVKQTVLETVDSMVEEEVTLRRGTKPAPKCATKGYD